MTVDERIDKLVAAQEKNELLMTQVLESIMRLERIAVSHEMRLQDTEAAIARLEGRERKPQ